MATMTKEKLITRMGHQKAASLQRLGQFRLDLDANPTLTLANAGPAFEAAAHLAVAVKVLDAFTGDDSRATVETITNYARGEVLKQARQGVPNSSNWSGNTMDLHEMAAWGDLYENLLNGGIWW